MMDKVNYVEKGALRYVEGEVIPFDQKNEMFNRPFWDPSKKELCQKFYFDDVYPKEKSGYTLKDQSLVNASWFLENDFAGGTNCGQNGLYDWHWKGKFDFPRTPSGLKISTKDIDKVTNDIKKAALFFGASLVGICQFDRRWMYSSAFRKSSGKGVSEDLAIPSEFKYVIALAFDMDYKAMACSPTHPAAAATGLCYSKMAFTAGLVAQFIRGIGYQAIPAGNDTALSIPIAIDAGLGEIARNGLLVTPEFGPRVRLAKVITDLPLVPDRPVAFGVWEFCKICKKCAFKCPSQSIMYENPSPDPHNISNRENVNCWHINAETCLDYWAKNGTDCSVCIRVCPFNKQPGFLHDIVRKGIKDFPVFNRAYLWGDDLMGYGKKKTADTFWEDRLK